MRTKVSYASQIIEKYSTAAYPFQYGYGLYEFSVYSTGTYDIYVYHSNGNLYPLSVGITGTHSFNIWCYGIYVTNPTTN